MSLPTVHAPEFSADLQWLNTPSPLTMRALRGQLVILDFWTYCCINCMHVLPVLARVEAQFAHEPVVVIGVHSAKFDNEKDASKIAEAIGRYGIEHPVLVDRDMRTWEAFAVRSWPTLVIVRPDGTLAAVAPGEPDPEVLVQFLAKELDLARTKGTLAKQRFALPAPSHRTDTQALAYPGKVAVGPDGDLAVADSGHHRVLVLDPSGNVVHTIGSGLAGHRDGSFDEAAFDDPQGLVWRGDTELFVADARSHTVARVDLRSKTVTTIAGTGELGEAPITGTAPATKTALRSPWDLCFVEDDNLYVALAGSHQIARLDLAAETVTRVAGTGVESIVDGPFARATFSQPSGLALVDTDKLYVADSETSAVRELDLDTQTVRTVVGVGLFDFGDVDGPRVIARLQHDIGIAADPEGRLVVADTYNHKLKTVDRKTGAVRTLAIGLSEPAGLAWDPSTGGWVVADTNHHRLVRVSAEGRSLAEVGVRGAPSPKRGRLPREGGAETPTESSWFSTLLRPAGGKALRPGAARLVFEVNAPPGKKLALGSPVGLSVEVSRRSDVLVVENDPPRFEGAGLPSQPVVLEMTVRPFSENRIEAEVVVRVDGVICDASDDVSGDSPAVCEPYRAWIRLPVPLSESGGDEVAFERA